MSEKSPVIWEGEDVLSNHTCRVVYCALQTLVPEHRHGVDATGASRWEAIEDPLVAARVLATAVYVSKR